MNQISSNVKELISKYNTNDVHQLIDMLGINIYHKNFKNRKTESCLIKNYDDQFSIFLRPNLDYRYEEFLLAHELGHYILHYDEDVSFYFLKGIYENRLEREANKFACYLLLSDLNSKVVESIDNFDFVVKEKGIPIEIWYSLNNF